MRGQPISQQLAFSSERIAYARNPLTHVDFLLFNQMDKQPVLAIEVDGTGFHEAGSKQAERDMKKTPFWRSAASRCCASVQTAAGKKRKSEMR